MDFLGIGPMESLLVLAIILLIVGSYEIAKVFLSLG